jgi:hypothetical protein
MTWAETYGQGPGQVENYLSWIGATSAGSRGEAPTRESVSGMVITGEDEVLRNLSQLIYSVPDKVMKRLEQNAEFILSESKKEVPWDTTHMMQTGTVEPLPTGDGFEIGYHTPYAERQHEDMTMYHPKPGRKAKYLEDPFMRIAPTIADDIAETLKEFLV